MFFPNPSHIFLKVDYKYIELCTLAAICIHRYGFSVLAKVISQGIDPHSFTAALFSKMSYAEFIALKNSEDPEKLLFFNSQRRKAKAINFGIPCGKLHFCCLTNSILIYLLRHWN